MAYPPAQCRKCKMVFPATAYRVENSTGMSFIGNSGEPCPYCGGMYDVLDGVYDFIGDTITLLSGPEATLDALRKAAVIVRDSKAAGEKIEKTVERVSAIFPKFAQLKGTAGLAIGTFAIQALWYLAGKFADPMVEPLVDQVYGKDLKPDVEIHVLVKNTVEETLRAQEAAARKAKVVQAPPSRPLPQAMPLAPKFSPSKPQFSKSMEKLQSDLKKRHSYQGLNGATKSPPGVQPQKTETNDRQKNDDR